MSIPLVLTFDIGTQSARAILVNPSGDIVLKAQKRFNPPYFSKNPNWAEQRPDFYWDAICEVSLALKDRAGGLWNDIIAVTSTTIRDSSICVDKNGKPLRDMILWLDKRETSGKIPLPKSREAAFRAVGMREAVELQRKVAACNWIMEYEPEIWAKTHKFIFLSGYITFKLSGKLVDSTANMIGHIPFDYKTQTWQETSNIARCLFDIEPEKLIDLVDPGDLIGGISEEAALRTGIPVGLPIYATGSDKGCETLGLSVTTPGKAAISFGTTATIQIATEDYVEPLKFMPAYPAVIKGIYNPEIQIYRGYWLISWFKNEFAHKEVEQAAKLGVAPEELLNARLREVPAGCEGLMLQPYFTPGVAMPKAKGSVIGFSDVHTRIHIYRAIIEGLNYALMDGMYNLEKRSKTKIDTIYLGGGGSQSDEICQITANMFGLPVYRIQTYEACGLGSSIVAFVSHGVFKDYDEALESMVHIKDVFSPDMKEHEIYDDLYSDIFRKVYKKLEPLYKKYKK
ncbi:MAG: FGGY-family carbohydrate kinase [Acutalibacteraceae bacterium]|jgi:sugar (pentulose or hexulose) kinase